MNDRVREFDKDMADAEAHHTLVRERVMQELQWESQRTQFKWQRWFWIGVVSLGVVSVIANAVVTIMTEGSSPW